MKYAIVIERGERNLSAFVPDFPGCVSTGSTIDEVRRNMRDAIQLHVAGMKDDGLPILTPSCDVDYVIV